MVIGKNVVCAKVNRTAFLGLERPYKVSPESVFALIRLYEVFSNSFIVHLREKHLDVPGNRCEAMDIFWNFLLQEK